MIIIHIIQYIGNKIKASSSHIRNLQILYVYYLNIMALLFSLATIYLFIFRANDKYKLCALSCALYSLSYIDFNVFTTNLFK